MATDIIPGLNDQAIENAYRASREAREVRRQSVADVGMRAARARDAKLLKVLDYGATMLQRMSETQHGVHGLDVGGIRVHATEFSLWREALKACDTFQIETESVEGKLRPYEWIYGAAAIVCGYAH